MKAGTQGRGKVPGLVASWVILLVAIATLVWLIPTAQAQENTVDYTLTDLSFRDFSGQQLTGTSFAAAEMREANFKGADLSRTILTKASFLRANLTSANLSGTFADRVIFDEANLTDARFIDAILTSSSFRSAEIAGADFSGAILDRYQITQLCQYADGTNSVTGTTTRDSLGCR
ncbi:MAG: pentapeptide repeat-containing protein [Cyanobacteria bacterium REEB459]|nr:pentapeptide repeat-containing protein [Cyanobacteria bacterium REEB459]